MKNGTTFVFVTTLTACLSFAGMLIHAESGAADGRLATPVGIATLGSCELKGEIVEEADGIYALFTTTNGDEKEIAFSYSVSYLAPAHPFARMIPMPQIIKQGRCTIVLSGKGEQVERILLQAKTPAVAPPDVPAALNVTPLNLGKATWTLAVSRSETVNATGWAAVAPPTVLKKTELADGAVILATSIMDVTLPAPS